jgi:hypothetical protein
MMEQKRWFVEGRTLCAGVRQAAARTDQPILCLLRDDRLTFAAVSGLRLVVSWETRTDQATKGAAAFVIPRLVAELLSSEVLCDQVGVQLSVQGQTVNAHLIDRKGSYYLRWQSDYSTFMGPKTFAELIEPPRALVRVPHLRFSDAAHQAVAKLGYMHAERQINPNKLAILIDLNFGRLVVDGKEIVTTERRTFYFDPRLVIRALEFVREETLRVGIRQLTAERGFLSMLSSEGEWRVHCALLSIGRDTQELYPLPMSRDS